MQDQSRQQLVTLQVRMRMMQQRATKEEQQLVTVQDQSRQLLVTLQEQMMQQRATQEEQQLVTLQEQMMQQRATQGEQQLVTLQDQSRGQLVTLQEQMTQQRATQEEQQLVTLQEKIMQLRVSLGEKLRQQLVILQAETTQQRAAREEQMGHQFATMQKLMSGHLDILHNLMAFQAHEITLRQLQCSKDKRMGENRMTLESHKNAPEQAQCSKNAKWLGGKNLYFPEEVVEKILARLPLPSLYKIRLLSRTWSAKLPMPGLKLVSSTSYSRTDVFPPPGMKSCLTPFQKEVILVSTNWTTYIPVVFTNKAFKGFDRVSCQWKSLFPLSYVLERQTFWDPSNPATIINSVGSLMLISSFPCDEDEYHASALQVVNVVTRSWKELITPLTIDYYFESGSPPDLARLLPGEFDTYRVLVIYQIEDDATWPVKTVLYDSSMSGCSVNYSEDLGSIKNFFSSSVYLHGNLYCLCDGELRVDPWKLCIHRVDSDKTWMAIPLNFSSSSGIIAGGVLLCGQKIMVVTWGSYMHFDDREEIESVSGNNNFTLPVIHIYQFDLNSCQLVNERKGPPESMLGVGLYREKLDYEEYIRFASDEDYIYCAQITPGIPVITYNIHSGEWGCLPPSSYTFGSMEPGSDESAIMLESCFAPGRNPFADV